MNPTLYTCPNCNKNFSPYTFHRQENKSVSLDKQYVFQFVNLFCDSCKKSINGINVKSIILWNQQYQFYYNKFVKNKNKNILCNKRYLYGYFPCNDKDTIVSLFKFIKLDQFDAIVIPQHFKDYVNFQGQICLLPTNIYECNINNIYPNYLSQKIILNESNRFLNSKLYSLYCTFFYNFNILYDLKDWQKLKLKLK